MSQCPRTWTHTEKLSKPRQFDDMHINSSSLAYVINYRRPPRVINPGCWPTSPYINIRWRRPASCTPPFDHTTVEAASKGKSKLLSCRPPCSFHQFTESLRLALMFVFFHTKWQRTRCPPLKKKARWMLNIFADGSAYFPWRDNMSVDSQAILKAAAWQVLPIKP